MAICLSLKKEGCPLERVLENLSEFTRLQLELFPVTRAFLLADNISSILYHATAEILPCCCEFYDRKIVVWEHPKTGAHCGSASKVVLIVLDALTSALRHDGVANPADVVGSYIDHTGRGEFGTPRKITSSLIAP